MNKQLVSALLCLASGLIGLAIAQSSFAQSNANGLLNLCISTGLSADECADMGFVAESAKAAPSRPNVVIVEIDEPSESPDTVMTVESTEESTVVTLSPSGESVVVRIFASGQSTIDAALNNCQANALSDEECGVFYREVFRGACEANALSGVLCDGDSETAIMSIESELQSVTTVVVVEGEGTEGAMNGANSDYDNAANMTPSTDEVEQLDAEAETVAEVVVAVEPTSLGEFASACEANGESVVTCFFDNQEQISSLCTVDGVIGVTECISALSRAR